MKEWELKRRHIVPENREKIIAYLEHELNGGSVLYFKAKHHSALLGMSNRQIGRLLSQIADIQIPGRELIQYNNVHTWRYSRK